MDIENNYGTLERQEDLLAMMIDLHDFLESQGIEYSLAWGSLIGAIREKGFVPWDDDMDIMMDRKNYRKFLACCGSLKNYEVQKVLWTNRIKRKIDKRGIWQIPLIDIFVIDNVPNCKFAHSVKILVLKILQGMMKKKPKNKNIPMVTKICSFALYYFGKLFSVGFKQRLYDLVSQFGNTKKTKYVGCFNTTADTIGLKYDSDLMDNTVLMCFEQKEFSVIKKYDEYLRIIYGDYMIPPEKSKRRPMHL